MRLQRGTVSEGARTKSAAGAVIIELALIIPAIITIALFVVQFSHALGHYQFALALSRTAANVAMRECLDVAYSRAKQCLQAQQNEIQGFADLAVEDTKVIMTLFEWDTPGVPSGWDVERVPAAPETFHNTTQTADTRFSASNGVSPNMYVIDNEFAGHGVMVVAEVYVPYYPIIDFFTQYVFPFDPERRAFYDASVL